MSEVPLYRISGGHGPRPRAVALWLSPSLSHTHALSLPPSLHHTDRGLALEFLAGLELRRARRDVVQLPPATKPPPSDP